MTATVIRFDHGINRMLDRLAALDQGLAEVDGIKHNIETERADLVARLAAAGHAIDDTATRFTIQQPQLWETS